MEKALAKKNRIIESIKQKSEDRQVELQQLMHQVFSLKNQPTVFVKLRKLTTSEKSTAATEWVDGRSNRKKNLHSRSESYTNFLMGMEEAERLLMKKPI